MRARALAALAFLLVLAAPAEASLLPRTQEAAKGLLRTSMDDAEHDARSAFLAARALVGGIRDVAPVALVTNGDLELRAGLAQPVVRGEPGILALVWAGAADEPWMGAYWITTRSGATPPSLVELHPEGNLLVLEAGALPLPRRLDVTYHFLGVDGRHVSWHAGRVEVLDETPTTGRAEFGAAVATQRGEPPEALFLTPWNLVGRDAEVGFSLHAAGGVLVEVVVEACGDPTAARMEAGCRQLYVELFPDELTHVTLWHTDADGRRSVDTTLTRAQLLAGHRFAP